MLTGETLSDRAEISDVVIRYATGIDQRDWDLYASCFADHVRYAIPFFGLLPADPVTRDEVVAFTRRGLGGFDVTQHLSSNHVIEIAGDEATCISAMTSRHILQGLPHYLVGGRYVNRLRRTPAGWKIYDCLLDVRWTEGDRTLIEQARGSAPHDGQH